MDLDYKVIIYIVIELRICLVAVVYIYTDFVLFLIAYKISKAVFHSLEWLFLSISFLDCPLTVDVFEALKGGWDG